MKKESFYGHDLAFIHHHGFGQFARKAGPEVLKILATRGTRGGVLVDLGCGSGIWARTASRNGFSVIGVDRSSAMIRLAKEISPRSIFHCKSLRTFPLPSCDAITVMGEGLNYLSGKSGPRDLAPFFHRAARALAPGGMLVFDMIVSEGEPIAANRFWRGGRNWVVMVDFAEDTARRLLTRTIITFRKVNNSWRRAKEAHHVALYSREEIGQSLRAAGFGVKVSDHYGEFALPPRRLAFIAQNGVRRGI
jgi:SAM-dependent methyltransferase